MKLIVQDYIDRIHNHEFISKVCLFKLCKSHLICIAKSLNPPKKSPPKPKASKSDFVEYIYRYIVDTRPTADEEIAKLKEEIKRKENAIEDLQTLRVKTDFEYEKKLEDKQKLINKLVDQVIYLVSITKLLDEEITNLKGQ